LSADNFRALGGEIPMPQRELLGAAQARKQPVILITAYHGPFDLLPVFLGYNGIRATTVYLPHSNASFDAFRRRVRTQSGCPALPVQAAVTQLPEILDGGGAVALLADHHAENKGIPVEFLGLPTAVSRAVGVLAVRHGAVVAVAGIRRTAKPFPLSDRGGGLLRSPGLGKRNRSGCRGDPALRRRPGSHGSRGA
jgi:lauroyl/myristoyl acyltransferase